MNHQFWTGCSICRGIITTGKVIEFFSDRWSYLILGACWCDTVAPNKHYQSEDKSGD